MCSYHGTSDSCGMVHHDMMLNICEVVILRASFGVVWFGRKWSCGARAQPACSPQPPSLSSTFPLGTTTTNQLTRRALSKKAKPHREG